MTTIKHQNIKLKKQNEELMKNNAPPSEIEELSQKVFLFQQMYENEKNQKEFFEQAY